MTTSVAPEDELVTGTDPGIIALLTFVAAGLYTYVAALVAAHLF